jgi:hypothetical protein
MTMSYSFQEPEGPPVCECRYDEVRDEVDRGNCQLHCDMEEEASAPAETQVAGKKPTTIARPTKENAA